MAAPPYPYHIILAGKYGVGKTSLFRFLSQRSQQNTSARGWDKYEHVVNLESEAVQVVLWDTANMEKNNVFSMSKSYFNECVGVILVYKKGDFQSLVELDKWWQRTREISQWKESLVFSLWCNEMDNYSDEIGPKHREEYIDRWKIPPELVFDVSADADDDGEYVRQSYRAVVAAVRAKCSNSVETSAIVLTNATSNIQKKCVFGYVG